MPPLPRQADVCHPRGVVPGQCLSGRRQGPGSTLAPSSHSSPARKAPSAAPGQLRQSAPLFPLRDHAAHEGPAAWDPSVRPRVLRKLDRGSDFTPDIQRAWTMSLRCSEDQAAPSGRQHSAWTRQQRSSQSKAPPAPWWDRRGQGNQATSKQKQREAGEAGAGGRTAVVTAGGCARCERKGRAGVRSSPVPVLWSRSPGCRVGYPDRAPWAAGRGRVRMVTALSVSCSLGPPAREGTVMLRSRQSVEVGGGGDAVPADARPRCVRPTWDSAFRTCEMTRFTGGAGTATWINTGEGALPALLCSPTSSELGPQPGPREPTAKNSSV